MIIEAHCYPFGPPSHRDLSDKIWTVADLVGFRRKYPELYNARRTEPPVDFVDDLGFSYSDGSPFPPDTITHAFRKLSDLAGLNGIRLHDLRHTHASLMLRQGGHPKIVQERLGHADVATTLNIYSHVFPGLQEQAALSFEEGLK